MLRRIHESLYIIMVVEILVEFLENVNLRFFVRGSWASTGSGDSDLKRNIVSHWITVSRDFLGVKSEKWSPVWDLRALI